MSYRDNLEAYARIIATERPYRPTPEERQLEQDMIAYLSSAVRDTLTHNEFLGACNRYDTRTTTAQEPHRSGLLARLMAFCFVQPTAPEGELWP